MPSLRGRSRAVRIIRRLGARRDVSAGFEVRLQSFDQYQYIPPQLWETC